MREKSIHSTVASGTLTLAQWARSVEVSSFQDEALISSQPNLISFGLGDPDPALFPRQLLGQLATEILETDRYALQYGPQSQTLKANIVKLMAQRGVHCTERQIFLTNGAQQGISLLARVLLEFGGQVLTEEMLYPDFQQLLETYQATLLTVRSDLETGIDVERVEALLVDGARPAFIYSVTDGHNPLGISMSISKRQRLVQLARQYGVPIIEDDVYGFLHYGDRPNPPMRSLDDEWVLYVSSFSKILAPALRVGWIVVPEALVPKLSVAKQANDLDTATFSQRIIAQYVQAGHLSDHLILIRNEYGIRRDTMLRAIEQYFPERTHWTRPTSGVFVWVELPPAIHTAALLKRAIKEAGVIFIPGELFCMTDSPYARHCLRLNYSNCTPERIEHGIAQLGALLRGLGPGDGY